MKKPEAPQSLARVLAADATLAAWTARHRREEELLRSLRAELPRPVAERVFVADASGPVLELSTATGAIATVVRQRAPDLLESLRREKWEFTGLRVRVQPRAPPALPVKSVPRQWDSNARRPLAALAGSLADTPLRSALARLLRRLG